MRKLFRKSIFSTTSKLGNFWRTFTVSLLFDTYCFHCKNRPTEGNGFLCNQCLFSIKPSPVETYGFRYLDGALSFAPYEGIGKNYLQLIKFQGAKSLIPFLGEIVKPTFERFYKSIQPNIVTYVPTHPLRVLFTRGFDQTEEILKVIYPNYVTLFKRSPAPQRPLYLLGDKQKRAKHLKGSFKLVYKPLETLKGKKVLIVDDLLTTGATGESLAYLLKSVGTKEVFLFTLFRRGGS